MPSAATRLLLKTMNANRGVVTWSSYVAGLAPLAWYQMRQTSGTSEPNSGSLGSAVDMTITSTTLGQTGKLGANEAYLLDGANSRLQTPNNATLAGLTTWEYVFLINPATAGESAIGNFFCWDDASSEPNSRFSGLTSIVTDVYNTTPTQFRTTTTTGLTAATWALLFIAFDNAGDRKLHLYKGVSAAVAEYAYSAQPAMTGTYRTPVQPLNLFNTTSQSRTFDGLADEVIIFNRNLIAGERTRLAVLAEV